MTAASPPLTVLVAPNQYPDMALEQELADDFGLALTRVADATEFRDALPHAAVVLLTPHVVVGPEEVALMTQCKAVVRYGIGYDNVDVAAARSAGIPVSVVPDASTEEVATHALAMGLSLLRRLPHGATAIADGHWADQIAFEAPRLTSLDVGIVGMGRIGRLVASWWTTLGARVVSFDPFVPHGNIATTPLDVVLAESDIVSLHVPLTDETRHMIDSETLSRMRRGSAIVNVSRGGLVDEVALADALRNGHISGVGLDVFADEPISASSPLRSAPHAILTPHIAWRSNASLTALRSGTVERARRALSGETIPDVVN